MTTLITPPSNHTRPTTDELLEHAYQLGREGGSLNEAVALASDLANEVRRLQRVHRTELKQQSGVWRGRVESKHALLLQTQKRYNTLKGKFGREMLKHDLKLRAEIFEEIALKLPALVPWSDKEAENVNAATRRLRASATASRHRADNA